MTIENIFYITSLIACNFLYLKNFLSRETKNFSLIQMFITPILIFILWGRYFKSNEYFFLIEVVAIFLAGAIGQIIAALYKYIEVTINEEK